MKYNLPVRHGDVDLIPVDQIPKEAKERKSNIVMHGESGHVHKLINGQILIHDDQMFVKSTNETYLTHEEHKKTLVPEGIFEVKQEEEFDPFADTIRRVRD